MTMYSSSQCSVGAVRWVGRLRSSWLLVCRLLLGTAFLWSAVPKIIYPDLFLSEILAFQLVSVVTATWIAAILPWVEVTMGLCLVGGLLTRGALAASVVMLGGFTALHVWAYSTGLQISCGCFSLSKNGSPIGLLTILRNSLLLLTAILGLLASLRIFKFVVVPKVGRSAAASDSSAFRDTSSGVVV